jgi:predicted AAA+ superfamily ATPase
VLPGAFRVDLLKESSFIEVAGHADRLERLIDGAGARDVILDEIQKVPSLLDEVHRLIERRGFRFGLTGSSARKLRRAGVNLLAGRAVTLSMHPFSASELGAKFKLATALRRGLLPVAWNAPEPDATLRSYVGTYLREEVQQEALVRNLGAFSRFLEAASFSQAASLNMNAVATDTGISRKTVESHFTLLEDLLLAVRLPVFRRRAARKLTAHPKFLYFDAGVWRALRPRGPLDTGEEIDGPALETLVFQCLRAENANRDLGYELFFWKAVDGKEVDFVLYGERGLHAFEVKRSHVFKESELAGLRAFLDDYPVAKGHFLYGGDKRYRFGNIEVLPVAEALLALPETLA